MTEVAESLKAVVCGSNHPSNLRNILAHIAQLDGLGYEVFPTRKELADDLPNILTKGVLEQGSSTPKGVLEQSSRTPKGVLERGSSTPKHIDGSFSMDKEFLKIEGDKMWEYLRKVAEANVVYVANEKNGREYIGNGTSIVLGFALAYEKHITFLHVPTDGSILSALVGYRKL